MINASHLAFYEKFVHPGWRWYHAMRKFNLGGIISTLTHVAMLAEV